MPALTPIVIQPLHHDGNGLLFREGPPICCAACIWQHGAEHLLTIPDPEERIVKQLFRHSIVNVQTPERTGYFLFSRLESDLGAQELRLWLMTMESEYTVKLAA